MRLEAAAAAVAYLTAMTTGWNDDATEQLVYEFEQLDDEAALGEAVASVARSWTWSSRPSLGVIMDAYRHQVALGIEHARTTLAARAVRCDGSGWLVDDDLAPCPTCNPALHRVWNEPGAKLRWRHGIPTWRVLDCDSAEAFEKEYRRERCPAALEVEHAGFDSRIGMRVALDTYRETYRREPSAAQRAWIVGASRPARSRSDEF